MWDSTLPCAVSWAPTAERGEESGSGTSPSALALAWMASALPSLGAVPRPVLGAAAASQHYPGLPLLFGLCLHQQRPNNLSLQMAEADVGMEMLLVHFTAEELSHEA